MKHQICSVKNGTRKTTALFSALLALLMLSQVFRLAAQNLTKIGDQVPDITLTNVYGYPKKTVKISDFKGKLLIIDFWATWCSPCRAAFAKMDSLQKMYADKVQFLPVSYEAENVVFPVLANLKKQKDFDLPGITGDVALHKLFPHRELPHYIWIGPDGKVIAITEGKYVNKLFIKLVLNGKNPDMDEKVDIRTTYDNSKPLLSVANGGDTASIRYRSMLSGYLPGISSGVTVTAFDSIKGQTFTFRNLPIQSLYQYSHQLNSSWFPQNQMIVRVKDTTALTSRLVGGDFKKWLEKNGYCYELNLPPYLAKTNGFRYVQEDLKRLFPQYSAKEEMRTVKCLALVRTSSVDKLRTKGGDRVINITPFSVELKNTYLIQLMYRFGFYMQNSPIPIVDLTGYKDKIDMFFDAKMTSLSEVNAQLKNYDLALEEREAPVTMLVIDDVVPEKK